MKTVPIRSYQQFVNAGRPYYPTESARGLLVCSFAVNCRDAAFGHKKRLLVEHTVLINRMGFVAVQCAWISRYGYRCRWFYWQDGKRVTFHRLSWDNKRKVCLAWQYPKPSNWKADDLYPPSRNWKALAGLERA